MDPSTAKRPRPRPAHTQGATRCAYTGDGSRLVTVGSNNTIRLYKTGSDGEPTNIDDCQEQNVAMAAGDDVFVVGSEDGTVSLYSLATAGFERFLLRTSLPVRDVALSRDGQWCAVASDELGAKVVSTADMTRVRHLREHQRQARHVSLDPRGELAAVSCVDGVIYVYSLTAAEPELVGRVDGLLAAESEALTRATWHPDGSAFAVATATRDIQVVSRLDWARQRCFADGHLGDVTCVAWSPNGALLATAGRDGKLLVWETETQRVVQRHDYANVVDVAWHPTANVLSFATSDGEVYIYTDFLPAQLAPLLKLPPQRAPLGRHGRAAATTEAPGDKRRRRRDSLGSLDSFLAGRGLDEGDDDDDDDDDGGGFVVDDDGAGYAGGGAKRRRRDDEGDGDDDDDDDDGGDDGDGDDQAGKRTHLVRARHHEAFQPGSTPWRGKRRYLCLNLVGAIWTVDQGAHHTVTVEFYDDGLQRDFHFTDTFLYDKACLHEHGALFACGPRDGRPGSLFYRPHECWTQRAEWRTELPDGEAATAIALSGAYVTAATSAGYLRVYTLCGVPCRVQRAKSAPTVACASWRDYVMTVGNGPVGGDGRARLVYSIDDVRRDDVRQNEDTVALPAGATLKSLFFSDQGDPCIFDSTGTLLTLLHWRRPGRAVWLPLLDTRQLARLASGRKRERYFAVGVAEAKFHCIILKGGDEHPYFPRPLLSEFALAVPLAAGAAGDATDDGDDGDGERQRQRLEHEFVLRGVQAAQLRDAVAASAAGRARQQAAQLARAEREQDKTLLQLLAVECREGEERGMRALELVALMRDRSGRMVEAAGRVAERYGRRVLGDKIRELGEKRVAGGDDDDDDDDDDV